MPEMTSEQTTTGDWFKVTVRCMGGIGIHLNSNELPSQNQTSIVFGWDKLRARVGGIGILCTYRF